MTKAKPVIFFLLKLLISAGLIGYFLSRIHIERFLQTFASANFSYIALALGVYLVAQGISAVRWATLARPLGIKTPFKDLIQYYLIGMFFNLFAPSTVGGDVTRVYYLVKDEEAHAKGRPVTTVHAAMSVLMDRAIGMVVLVWLGALGLLLFPNYAVPQTARTATFLLALGLLVGALLTPVLKRFLPEDGHHLAVKLRLALRSYRLHWRALLAAAAAFLDGSSDSSVDAYGDGAGAGFGSAFFLLSHCLSAGRNVCGDSDQLEWAGPARRRLHFSLGGDRHRHGTGNSFWTLAVLNRRSR